MTTAIRAVRRSALLGVALLAAGTLLAPQASATEDPYAGPGDPPIAGSPQPWWPSCFGEPATIIMTTPGHQLGTPGNDVIVGSSGDDFIDSLGGHDRICAKDGVDRITADWDPVTGNWDPEIIVIGEPDDGDDWIDGQGDGDVVTPGAGDDHVWGSDGTDFLYGQLGDDTIDGGDKADYLDCDEGEDYADGGRGSNDWVSWWHECETLYSASETGS